MSLFKKLLENLGWFTPETEIAVLIDAENVSFRVAEAAIAEAKKIGRVQIIKAYYDWTSTNPAAPPGYLKLAGLCGLQRVQVDRFRKRKNSADLALAADAAFMAGSGIINTIVLVSEDVDFIPLAQTLRGAGCKVIGMAGRQAALDLRPACHQFIIIEAPNPIQSQVAAVTVPA